jgi:hypothetical protein
MYSFQLKMSSTMLNRHFGYLYQCHITIKLKRMSKDSSRCSVAWEAYVHIEIKKEAAFVNKAASPVHPSNIK